MITLALMIKDLQLCLNILLSNNCLHCIWGCQFGGKGFHYNFQPTLKSDNRTLQGYGTPFTNLFLIAMLGGVYPMEI